LESVYNPHTSSHGLAGVELTKPPLNALTSNQSNCNARVKTQLTMLRFNGLVNRIGGPTDAGELVLV
ncbi:MAG: hypothetical protein WBD97_20610, partial [Pseudolabrys sp.]